MAEPGVGSSLRRLCASTGAVVALCLVWALPGLSAPSPDPPPLSVTPEPRPQPAAPAPIVRRAPVASPTVVRRSTPDVSAPVRIAKPKAVARARVRRVAKPKAAAPASLRRSPHDRSVVPPVAFVPAVDSLDRDLLALAGLGLLLVALGGAVVLFAARRQLRGSLA